MTAPTGIDSTTLARALGGHDDAPPSDAAHLRKLADETEAALIAHEVQFADDGWRDVLRLRALAAAMQDYVCARHRCFAPVDGGCPACRAERERDEAERRADEAVEWIGVVRDELVMAGGKPGDRTVALANLRSLVRDRNALQAENGRMRHEDRASREQVARLKAEVVRLARAGGRRG